MTAEAASTARDEPRLLRETDSWIILDKPRRWHTVSQPAKNAERAPESLPERKPDVETWLNDHFVWAKSLDEGGIVHRLDYETSGCLVVAKNEETQHRLRQMFRSADPRPRSVRKTYLAMVGPGLAASGEFTLFLTSRHKRSKKVTVKETGDPRHEGRCRWRKIPPPLLREGARGWVQAFDILEIELLGPGRRHQIRAGMAHLGHPLLGDALYGGRESPGGFFLHAWKLSVEGVETSAPLPPHWPLVAP